jgi:hypothetical protein
MGTTGHQAVVPSQPQAPRLRGQADGHLTGRSLGVEMDEMDDMMRIVCWILMEMLVEY